MSGPIRERTTRPAIPRGFPSMKLHAVLLFILLAVPSLSCAERPRILFDTDITGDVDDVLARAMCHTLADRGACDLLEVTISKHHPLTASFVDAQNTFHGRPDLPIGVTRDPMAQSRESSYLQLAKSPHYPHDLRHNSQAADAVQLLRTLLASQTNHSVIIVSVGIASNLANLLSSDGGPDLIRQKVVPSFRHTELYELWGHTKTATTADSLVPPA
jgi:purine nucleosidase